jgi:dCTP deaminase
MILSDNEIKELCLSLEMIKPFEDKQKREGVISYGVSSYGYDFRIDRDYKIFTNSLSRLVDPKNFDTKVFVDYSGDECIIPPNSFILGKSVEYFKMPKDVMGICVGKSTYARCGLIVNVTPIEPGWEGYITIEVSNTTPLPAKIYSGEGICQLVFFKGNPCSITYADKKGKYQCQKELTLPKI